MLEDVVVELRTRIGKRPSHLAATMHGRLAPTLSRELEPA
jgi:hypothetical protein